MRFLKNKLINTQILLLSLTLCMSYAYATEDSSPLVILKNVINTVMSGIKQNKAAMQKSKQNLYNFVDKTIIPHVDFVEMGKWVVGRNAWQVADAATRQAFVNEFKVLVVRTYADALLSYNNQQVEFMPLRNFDASKPRVQISTIIKDANKDLHIDYNMLNTSDGWKVYDIIIENVSLVRGYNAQFEQDIKVGGLSVVIEKIRKHNKEYSNSFK